MNLISIGQVAKECGTTVEAIRFYEKEALLGCPSRSESGYRQYSENSVRQLRFIQNAKAAGFTLKEIKELLRLTSQPLTKCTDVKEKAQCKLDDIEEKISNLQKIKAGLQELVDSCTEEGGLESCPIIDALENKRLLNDES